MKLMEFLSIKNIEDVDCLLPILFESSRPRVCRIRKSWAKRRLWLLSISYRKSQVYDVVSLLTGNNMRILWICEDRGSFLSMVGDLLLVCTTYSRPMDAISAWIGCFNRVPRRCEDINFDFIRSTVWFAGCKRPYNSIILLFFVWVLKQELRFPLSFWFLHDLYYLIKWLKGLY